jgi:MurNAc alpha-1-phosphate uridylyltransferase
MIFAAGFGTRMRHLTKSTPKPLVPVLGKPMIDHTIDIALDAGIQSVFINTHYFADQLEKHLSSYSSVTAIREEPEILETGGGLKNALPHIGTDPIITMNCDAIWLGNNPVVDLAKHWNPKRMDGLLLLLNRDDALGYSGSGDFFLGSEKTLSRKDQNTKAPYVYSGVQIIQTDLLKYISETCFSVNLLWEEMIANKRLFGEIYDGQWVDVGHPEGIDIAHEKLANV